jgi:hypothetical protein
MQKTYVLMCRCGHRVKRWCQKQRDAMDRGLVVEAIDLASNHIKALADKYGDQQIWEYCFKQRLARSMRSVRRVTRLEKTQSCRRVQESTAVTGAGQEFVVSAHTPAPRFPEERTVYYASSTPGIFGTPTSTLTAANPVHLTSSSLPSIGYANVDTPLWYKPVR